MWPGSAKADMQCNNTFSNSLLLTFYCLISQGECSGEVSGDNICNSDNQNVNLYCTIESGLQVLNKTVEVMNAYCTIVFSIHSQTRCCVSFSLYSFTRQTKINAIYSMCFKHICYVLHFVCCVVCCVKEFSTSLA